MEEHFVFRLGPLEKEDGVFFMYYVFPGYEDAWAFPAPSDTYALERILDLYNAENLVFEPALMDTAKDIGARVEEHSPNTAHELALMAYEHLSGGPIRNIKYDSLLYHFARSVLNFHKGKPWKNSWSSRPLRVEISGDYEITTWCFIHPYAEDREELFSILFEAADNVGEFTTEFSSIKNRSRLTVLAKHGPQFAVDAMRRAHGLSFMPLPYVLNNGVEILTNDLQISILTTALTALVSLNDDEGYAESKIELENLKVSTSISID